MKIKERMITSVSVCHPGDNLAQVAATMWDDRCGALPVVDAGFSNGWERALEWLWTNFPKPARQIITD